MIKQANNNKIETTVDNVRCRLYVEVSEDAIVVYRNHENKIVYKLFIKKLDGLFVDFKFPLNIQYVKAYGIFKNGKTKKTPLINEILKPL